MNSSYPITLIVNDIDLQNYEVNGKDFNLTTLVILRPQLVYPQINKVITKVKNIIYKDEICIMYQAKKKT